MSEPRIPPVTTEIDAQHVRAFDAGRRAGLATAALALSLIAYLNLLGAEKALLAIALALLARRGSPTGSAGRRLATVAIGVAAVFLASITFILIMFWDDVAGLVNSLRRLS